PEPVHPIGKPISHSTNSGFNCRRGRGESVEDPSPSFIILGAWRPRSAFVGAFGDGSVPSFQSREVGVAQFTVCACRSPLDWSLGWPILSALAFGVTHIFDATCRLVIVFLGPPGSFVCLILIWASGDLLSSFAIGVGHIATFVLR